MLVAALAARSRAVRRRAGGEEGFALPLALAIIVLTGLLVLAAVAMATHNTDRANRDREVVRARQAADAGVDSALYRLNKTLVASQAGGLLGVPVTAAAQTLCVQISAGQIIKSTVSGSWCSTVSGTEQLDGPLSGDVGWAPASYQYRVSSGINLGVDPGNSSANLIERRIVSTGTANGVTERVEAIVRASVGSSGNLFTVFQQVGYTTCTPQPTDASDPASGC